MRDDNSSIRKGRIQEITNLYIDFIRECPIKIPDRGMIAGFTNLDISENRERFYQMYTYDNCHYPMGYGIFEYGIGGIIEKTRAFFSEDQERNLYIKSIHDIYVTVSEFIHKHCVCIEQKIKSNRNADEEERLYRINNSLETIIKSAPDDFLSAVQLYWIIYRLRNVFGSGSMGRLDKILYPFYIKDANKGYPREYFVSIISELFQKLNSISQGDTLRNIMLSGTDEKGQDVTNDLTYIIIDAYLACGGAEPHINVRLNRNSPEKLMDKIVKMIKLGGGQPTLYRDENIIPQMIGYGIEKQYAVNYGNDGCTETLIDGASGIVFWQHESVKSLELALFNGKENPSVGEAYVQKSSRKQKPTLVKTNLTLGYQSGDIKNAKSFDEVFDIFMKQFLYQVDKTLDIINQRINEDQEIGVTSPFIAATFSDCLDTGLDCLRGGGFRVSCYQLLSGSIPTTADCLEGIRYAVFEKEYCTMEELINALIADFEGYEKLRANLLSAPKFGNNIDSVDLLASRIAEAFCNKVLNYKTDIGITIWPGIYNIDFDLFAKIVGATPDGRKWKDPICEHYSPTPGRAINGPTSIINSAIKAPLHMGFASSPLYIALNDGMFTGCTDYKKSKTIETLIKVAFDGGIPVLNLSLYNKEILREAQRNPQQYQQLIVRVWGFNAKFIDLTCDLQNHIIDRINS